MTTKITMRTVVGCTATIWLAIADVDVDVAIFEIGQMREVVDSDDFSISVKFLDAGDFRNIIL